MNLKCVDFDEFQRIAQQSYENAILLQTKTNEAIATDVAALHSSCPCGKNDTCANIAIAIPIIQHKHGLSKTNNSVAKRELLVNDIKCREMQKVNYNGRVIFCKDKACAFFLMFGKTILRFVATGECGYSYHDMFALLLQQEQSCYLYTDATQSFVEANLKIQVSEVLHLGIILIPDRSPSKKMFLITA